MINSNRIQLDLNFTASKHIGIRIVTVVKHSFSVSQTYGSDTRDRINLKVGLLKIQAEMLGEGNINCVLQSRPDTDFIATLPLSDDCAKLN